MRKDDSMTTMIGVFSDKEPVQFLAENYCRITRQHRGWDVNHVIQVAQTNVALYQLLQKYEVRADSVADFIRRYRKRRRMDERKGVDLPALIADCEEEFRDRGYLVIAHTNSTTGRTVSYYGRKKRES